MELGKGSEEWHYIQWRCQDKWRTREAHKRSCRSRGGCAMKPLRKDMETVNGQLALSQRRPQSRPAAPAAVAAGTAS